MTKKSITEMNDAELQAEIAKMDGIMEQHKGTLNFTHFLKLASAKHFKLALERVLNNRKPAPAPTPGTDNVVSLADFKAKRAK